MQVLDHFSVELNDTLAFGARGVEGFDDASGVFDFGAARCPDVVCDCDLVGVDQGLAVETHLHSLCAFIAEAVGVLDVVVDAVENRLVGFACGEECGGEMRDHRCATRNLNRTEFLHEVVGSHDEDRYAGV